MPNAVAEIFDVFFNGRKPARSTGQYSERAQFVLELAARRNGKIRINGQVYRFTVEPEKQESNAR